MRRLPIAAALLCPLAAGSPLQAQYVGKVTEAQGPPPLRAVAVYEYTGALTKPNASRLVPVVVWDGTNFEPGGLYKAEPEPLAVAPGTQYVLTPDGMPGGLYNVLSSAQLGGGWVGLGRYAAPPPPPPVHRLRASKTLPVLHGGSIGKETEHAADGGPVLHRRADAEGGASGSGQTQGPVLHKRDSSGTTQDQQDSAGPALHRRDTDSSTGSNPPAEDPDRPRLHEGKETASAPEPDRPLLHRHGGSGAAEGAPPPDPGRPRLRYGSGEDADTRVLPTLLKAPPKTLTGDAVPVGQVVAISDVTSDEPHPFAYHWPNAAAKAEAEARMHALALRALASRVRAGFGPAATTDAALQKAADDAEASLGPATSTASGAFGPATHRRVAKATEVPDPLVDPDFRAFELSYGGGVTLVYSAHTAPEGADRRFVTVMAQLNFAGAPQQVFAQTTRGDMLAQTPALHLVDAVDAKGDHRADLLFDERTSEAAAAPRDRQFALYSVYGGQAEEVYSTSTGAMQ